MFAKTANRKKLQRTEISNSIKSKENKKKEYNPNSFTIVFCPFRDSGQAKNRQKTPTQKTAFSEKKVHRTDISNNCKQKGAEHRHLKLSKIVVKR